MARFKADDADRYGSTGGGGGGFFNIQNDKEVKEVRFLYETVDDIEGMSVHKIKVKNKDGELKDRYVNCLREYSDPMDVCPFCNAKMPTQARLFIPLYNITDDEVQIWDRGKTMFQTLTSVCERATKKGSLIINHIFEVERNGKPKDKKTTYGIFETEEDDTELSDFEIPEILGPKNIVLDKSAEDMEYFLEEHEFPPVDDDAEEEEPVRRRSGRTERNERAEESEERPSRDRGRRTPASSRKKEDVY